MIASEAVWSAFPESLAVDLKSAPSVANVAAVLSSRALPRFRSYLCDAQLCLQIPDTSRGHYWTCGVVSFPSPTCEVRRRYPEPHGCVVSATSGLCFLQVSSPCTHSGVPSFPVGAASPASSMEIEREIPDFTSLVASITMRPSSPSSAGASDYVLYIPRAALLSDSDRALKVLRAYPLRRLGDSLQKWNVRRA